MKRENILEILNAYLTTLNKFGTNKQTKKIVQTINYYLYLLLTQYYFHSEKRDKNLNNDKGKPLDKEPVRRPATSQ